MNSTVLNNIFSSSATVLMIMRLYKTKPSLIGKAIGLDDVNDVVRWKNGYKQIGKANYRKLIKVYPEFENRIDYDGTYTP